MADQQDCQSKLEKLKWYANASSKEKETARNYMNILFKNDSSKQQPKGESAKSFASWCDIKRTVEGYNVSHSEIKKKLGVSDSWINNNIKPVVRWFRVSATRDRGASSVFYNRDDLNDYLMSCCSFAIRTVLIDLNDPRYGYSKDVIENVEKFKKLLSQPLRPHTSNYADYIKLLAILEQEIPEFISALHPAERCRAEDISCKNLGIADLWSCEFHTKDDLVDSDSSESENAGQKKYSGGEMFERAMYERGCIRIALGGYDSKGKSKKKVYIDNPYSQNLDQLKLTRVSYIEFRNSGHGLADLPSPICQLQESESATEDTKANNIPFSIPAEWQEIISDVSAGKHQNIFLTGGAGTGKTTLMKLIVDKLRESKKQVLICAPTAIAALNADENFGRTLHSVFKIDPEKIIPVDSTGSKTISVSLIDADAIVIDEVSMTRLDIFRFVIRTIEKAEKLRYDKEHPENIGQGSIPKQLIFVGDFFQFSPVITKENMADLIDNGWSIDAIRRGGYCFFTDEWQQRITTENTIELKVPFRQSDPEFIEKLNMLRNGCGEDVASKDMLVKYFNRFNRSSSYSEKIVELCPRNELVDAINKHNLSQLTGEEKSYPSIVTFLDTSDVDQEAAEDDSVGTHKPVSEYIRSMLWEDYSDLMLVKLKVGARVIMTTNNGKEFSNGSQGIITELEDDTVTVSLLKNGKYEDPIKVQRHDYTAWLNIKPNDQPSDTPEPYQIRQFPIKISYAITIHRAQGLTLEAACIHPQVFSDGALYVALSRVKDPAKLFLSDKLARRFIKASKDVIDFYNNRFDRLPKVHQEKQIDIESIKQLDAIVGKLGDYQKSLVEPQPGCTVSLDDIKNDLKRLRRELLIENLR